MKIDPVIMIGIAVVGILVQYGIFYLAAYNSREKERQHMKIQTQLLVRMARKAGVEEAEIQDSLNIK